MAYADDDPGERQTNDCSSNTLISRADCGMARAADLIGDRWTLLILREALYGITRFDAMQADLGVPRTVLAGRLRKLCEAGVMTKRPYKVPGQRLRHQYVLTSKGVELALPMIALMQWGDKHLGDGEPRAEIVARKTGAALRAGLTSTEGAPVSIGETMFRLKDTG